MTAAALIAMHYQNENCHPDGRIKIGIADENTWREARLANARRLFAGFRSLGLPIVHVRLAVRPDFADVVPNTPIFRQWIENEAWREGTWGVEFVDGLGPEGSEHVVTHTRNGGFHGSTLAESLFLLKPQRLYCSGVSTAYAVESTVREATDRGWETTVVADACSTATAEQHEAALRAMSLIADIRTTDAALAELSA